jgi:hypothetical protein
MSTRYYAFQGYVYAKAEFFADSFVRLGDARRAAKEWVDRTHGRTAILLQEKAREPGHQFGTQWDKVGEVKWTT